MPPYWLLRNDAQPGRDALLYGPVQVVSTADRIDRSTYGLDLGLGETVTRAVPPLEVRREPGEPGILTDQLAVMGATAPVLNGKARAVLAKCGVDCIQYFPISIIDAMDGGVKGDWQVANITRRMACLDAALSRVERDEDGDIRFIDRLAIDPRKAGSSPMFRLAEFSRVMVVSASVKNAIESAGLSGFRFLPPDKLRL